jgi:hypothetical protein
MESGIYIIKNIINSKLYIGSTCNFKTRFKYHLKKLRNNNHDNQKLQKAWNKYGEDNFIFEILKNIPYDKKKSKLKFAKVLINEEQLCLNSILFANEKNNKFEKLGYNLCRSARNNFGFKNDRMKVYNETVKLKPIYQYDLNGNFIKEWESISAAALFLNTLISGISNCCCGRIKTSAGFVWRFKSSIMNKNKKIKHSEFKSLCSNPILQYDTNGNFLKEWSSAKVINFVLKININRIGQVCLGRSKRSGGFYWIYKKSKKIALKIKIPCIKKSNKQVIQYNLNGEKVKIWESLRLAAISLKNSKTTIRKSCLGNKIRGEFYFKYKQNDK